MKCHFERLLRPKSIAVVGGGAWCENVIKQSRNFGFSGPIWPVHPTKTTFAGEPAFPSINALPQAPDATFIGINRQATIEAVRELADMGAGGAVCFASGFQEADAETGDGADAQAQLLAAAGDMTLIGPNCYGFINYLDGALLWPDQHGGGRCDSGVAIITQSSNIAINITMQQRALPLAYVVTVGNQAQVDMAEIGAALLQDTRVTALGLHIEGIGDIAALEALAKQGKPVVALKVGQSDQARAATISHTASLAGSDAGARALLKRLGIAQVETLPEFLESLKLLHVCGPLRSNHIASMSCSGGEASLMADLAIKRGVTFPPLNDTQMQNLRATLGPKVSLANPLDYHTYIWPDADAMADAFTAMMDPSLALGILVSDFPRADRCDGSDWDSVIKAVSQTQKRTGQPMAIAASLPENMPESIAMRLIKAGITPLNGLQEAIVAAKAGADCGQKLAKADPILLPRPPLHSEALTEAQAKAALARHRLMIPKSSDTADVSSLSFPLVLKGQGIAHKTEAGAVVLGLSSPDQVKAAMADMTTDSFLLEEMVTGGVAELLVGVVLDAAHGYVLTLGAGGTLTELLNDTASLLIPSSRNSMEGALRSLKIFKLLAGYRGKPAADLPAILDAICAVQDYVVENHGLVDEVEINPLICLQKGAIAADALIRIGEKND